MSDTTPISVQTAIARVMADLPAIRKDGKASPQQGGYAYRGIEQITSAAQRLFALHGLVIVPQVTSIHVDHVTVAGKPWTDTRLVVDYSIVGPDGSTLQATTVGIGRDNADKGANKAMSQAFKYLLLQLLCISDSNDDTDGVTHAADAVILQESHPLAQRVDRVQHELRNLDSGGQTQVKEWANGRKLSGAAMLADEAWLHQVEDWLDEYNTPAGAAHVEPDTPHEEPF